MVWYHYHVFLHFVQQEAAQYNAKYCQHYLPSKRALLEHLVMLQTVQRLHVVKVGEEVLGKVDD